MSQSAPAQHRTAEDIRIALNAPGFASIEVFRAAPGGSADLATAQQIAREDSESPAYGARYDGHSLLITAFEAERLLQAGATDVRALPIP